ncbi:MAG: hypothetical protein JWM21_2031 [Acidobacteria bacterium]|nr:hypothetical protein [Acidobacteriota bacterium]
MEGFNPARAELRALDFFSLRFRDLGDTPNSIQVVESAVKASRYHPLTLDVA